MPALADDLRAPGEGGEVHDVRSHGYEISSEPFIRLVRSATAVAMALIWSSSMPGKIGSEQTCSAISSATGSEPGS